MIDTSGSVVIELVDVPAGEASGFAAELREYLLDEDTGLRVEQVRPDPDNQDLGAALLLILAAPATLAVARGVQRWLGRRSGSTVVFKSAGGELKVTNLSSRRADDLSRELIRLLPGSTGDS